MPTTPLTGYVYPSPGSAANVPADLQALALAIEQRSVLIFASATARGSAFAGPGAPAPIAGMISYLVAEKRFDYFNGTDWITMTAGPWIALPLVPDYVAYAGSPAYRITNGTVELRGQIAPAGPPTTKFTLQAYADICTLPVGFRPTAFRYFTAATEWVSQTTARAEVQTSGLVRLLCPGPSGNAPRWISLDSLSFSTS